MRVTILTFGSRGDVEPYIALGAALARRRCHVRLATHTTYEASARQHGLRFEVLGGDPSQILASELGSQWLSAGRNPLRFARAFARVIEPLMREVAVQSHHACRDADVVLVSLLGFCAGRQVAESLRLPLVLAPYFPIGATREFPNPMMCLGPLVCPATNRLTHLIAPQLLWQPIRRSINAVRRDIFGLSGLSLPGLAAEFRANTWPGLYGYSRHVVPVPRDWQNGSHVTGYWFAARPSGWRPAAELEAFLADGPAPVCVGFGSMRPPNVEESVEMVVRALRLCGRRGLLMGALATADVKLPSTVHAVEFCPHDWLFSRVVAAVHHGGAGTTAAALRAGIPSIVVPFFADQPFWGWRVASLGVGPQPVPCRRLSAPRLAAAIERVLGDPELRRRARALGERIRSEDGVRRAANVFPACARHAPCQRRRSFMTRRPRA